MAILLVDETHTNDGNGDGWADQTGAGGARNNLAATVTAAANGDEIYIRNGANHTSQQNYTGNEGVGNVTNPIRVFGVKAATTDTTPAQSDLVPGLRTGDSTRAYDQTGGNAAPTITTNTGIDVQFSGNVRYYGIIWDINGDFSKPTSGNLEDELFYEECQFEWGEGNLTTRNFELGATTTDFVENHDRYLNCEFVTDSSDANTDIGGRTVCWTEFVGCIFTDTITGPDGVFKIPNGRVEITGCDFNGSTPDIALIQATRTAASFYLQNCRVNASTTLVESLAVGSIDSQNLVDFNNVEVDGTAKGAGESRRHFFRYTANGTVENDTAFTRAGGASDKASGLFARKMTPITNGTRENYSSIIGPWETAWLRGSGATGGMTVFIANDEGVDMNDDDAWVQVLYPAQDGGVIHDYTTTQMLELGTPSVIGDDTVSNWNGGGAGSNNAQKITVTITPGYEGPIMWRVHFAKNYSGAVSSLYYDSKAQFS